jgi:hypothetical protein
LSIDNKTISSKNNISEERISLTILHLSSGKNLVFFDHVISLDIHNFIEAE